MISKSVRARSKSRTFAVGVEYITEHSHQRALAMAGGGAFDGGVEYATSPQKAAWIEMRGVTSVETAAMEMERTARRSLRCKEPVYHLIVAYAKDEHPTREQVVQDAERLLAALKMEDHQYVLSAHQDTDDFHAHVIANRIGPDGRANDLWQERVIRERVCAEIAAERGWEIVVGHHNRDIVQRLERSHEMPDDPARRLDDRSYRRFRDQGELPWHDLARAYVLDAVDRAESWDDLHRRLDAHGVVVKLVQRGGRVQGFAFAEGLEASAPGCAASRIDARCAMSALEKRFGAFTPARDGEHGVPPREESRRVETIEDRSASQRWSDAMRSRILAEVDAARSWDDLKERLARHGVIVKLVERGGRVQGLAFAQGEGLDAPGCGASRIDARCKKATLEERFGSFPRDSQEHVKNGERAREGDDDRARDMRSARERKAERLEEARERLRAAQRDAGKSSSEREPLRDRVEREAREASEGSERAVHEAERIVDHARTRSAYGEYRKKFSEEQRHVGDARYEEAWEREQERRDEEAQRRYETRSVLRNVARIASRGPLRQLAYWSIDALMSRRRKHEFEAARARWEDAKADLFVERGQRREKKPMDYTTFAAERARAGDKSAKRVHDDLTQTVRGTASPRQERAPEPQRTVEVKEQISTISEVRARFEEIRAEETVRYEQAQRERSELKPVEEPEILAVELHEREEEIRNEVVAQTAFSDTERASLKRFVEEKKSWNPLVRSAATQAEVALRAEQQRRYEATLRDAMRQFKENEAPRMREQAVANQQRYDRYADKAYKLEAVMKDAQSVLRQYLPSLESELNVIERYGLPRIDPVDKGATLETLHVAINRCYQSIPEAARRVVEREIRDELKRFGRRRDSFSMDD